MKIISYIVQCILCGQYILADKFLLNSGCKIQSEVLSTFGCQFPSKRWFEKFKNTKILVKFDFNMVMLRCVFAVKINLVDCILCGQYILADRCLRNSVDQIEHEILSTFGCQFPSKRGFEKS